MQEAGIFESYMQWSIDIFHFRQSFQFSPLHFSSKALNFIRLKPGNCFKIKETPVGGKIYLLLCFAHMSVLRETRARGLGLMFAV